SIEDYHKYAIDLTEENYKDIKEFVSKFDQTISQFTVIESGENILILETTPQIVDNRLKIKDVKKISKEDFEKIFKSEPSS
ncbi:hypothetical protein, partial [Metasolibacillus meyeri]|uniref:hypothetical protein n=1 Tax=Metasolibacillus meyeri TaxID=1071052 RepID=UPI00187D1477